MTNLTAKISDNGYFWLEGSFSYYDDTNPTTLTIDRPEAINGIDVSGYDVWVEVKRTFGAQYARDFGEAEDGQYVITENNPKGTILTIKIYFIHPVGGDEIATNTQNIQFGINKAGGMLPPSAVPETKILDKAFIDFVIVGKSMSFYNVLGQKVSEGSFNDLVGNGELLQPNWSQTNDTALDFIKNKPTDLATGTYVDEELAKKLDKTGGTVSGALDVQGSLKAGSLESSAGEDLDIKSAVNMNGHAMYGLSWLNMGYHRIEALSSPENDTDAANKGYVDDVVSNKPSATGFTSIEVVDEYPDVELPGVLYLKKVTA